MSFQVCYKATPAHPALSISVKAPILLPSLHLLSSVAVADPNYWKTRFLPGESDDWPALRQLLSRGGHMRVKRKGGGGGLAQPARFTPWSLGKAHQEKLTSLGGMSCYHIFISCLTKHIRSLGGFQPVAPEGLSFVLDQRTSLLIVQVFQISS